jgi:hypothetical protein
MFICDSDKRAYFQLSRVYLSFEMVHLVEAPCSAIRYEAGRTLNRPPAGLEILEDYER